MSVICVILRTSNTSCPSRRLDVYFHMKHLYFECMGAFIPGFLLLHVVSWYQRIHHLSRLKE